MGRRTSEDAHLFAAKLSAAVGSDRFQVSTDGLEAYPDALEQHLGGRIDYGRIIKSFSGEGLDSERRYSPPSIIATEKRVISGAPEESRICTSHVERLNLHVRMMPRRFTRLTTILEEAGRPQVGCLTLRRFVQSLLAPLSPADVPGDARGIHPEGVDGAGSADGVTTAFDR